MKLQILEFELNDNRELITMQIMMPIETKMDSMFENFHNFGFDLMDAVHAVPYTSNLNVMLPVLSMTMETTLRDTLVSLGLIHLFGNDNSDFAFA